ncbi:bifunctional DNA primase/polymerase, partial [Candidatus Bathyarchaeota archaeon]|nr:bifunctional DNA primase/polymerase [Candidatus Bathyarchaeota archaeon]
MNEELKIIIDRLKEAGLSTRCFLKVGKDKAAFEKEWEQRLYDIEDLENHPRWGINGKDGLVLIDADNPEMDKVLTFILPDTFTTISPRRKLSHFYIKVVNGRIENKVLHLPNVVGGAGEIRAQNEYLVAPGTVIEWENKETGGFTTGRYEIVRNVPIAMLDATKFNELIKPYLGNDSDQRITPEIVRDGAPLGTRHAYAIRLAVSLIGDRKLDHNGALIELNNWLEHCTPPIHDAEYAARTVQAAIRYVAQREQDPNTKLNEEGDEPEDDEIRKEADALVSAPNLLEALTSYLDALMAGEDKNKKLTFILLHGGKAKDPSLILMIFLKGETGGGKTFILGLADLFKTKTVGRFTEHALDYSDLENFDVLRLKELGSMDTEDEKHGLSTIKFLSEDDKGYTVEYTTRDSKTGKFTTTQHRIPPITLISSTTRTKLDPQVDRRGIVISPDESQEQTERIRMWRVNDENERGKVALCLMRETSADHSRRVLKAFENRLGQARVVLPFPNALTNILQSTRLRVRGDYNKIIAMVKIYSYMNQKILPKIVGGDGIP